VPCTTIGSEEQAQIGGSFTQLVVAALAGFKIGRPGPKPGAKKKLSTSGAVKKK
jgi:hypothetical protein